jgi:hypothetical protein
MKIEIVTVPEAKKLGLVHSRLSHTGHGAFGEPENSYEDVVYVGKKWVGISDNDLIIFQGESPNREVIQILSEWNCSDILLELMNVTALTRRKKEKYKRYIELKKEIESDIFFTEQECRSLKLEQLDENI